MLLILVELQRSWALWCCFPYHSTLWGAKISKRYSSLRIFSNFSWIFFLVFLTKVLLCLLKFCKFKFYWYFEILPLPRYRLWQSWHAILCARFKITLHLTMATGRVNWVDICDSATLVNHMGYLNLWSSRLTFSGAIQCTFSKWIKNVTRTLLVMEQNEVKLETWDLCTTLINGIWPSTDQHRFGADSVHLSQIWYAGKCV